ncbi:MAG: TonB-dependent receptor [Gracilimonas sp.]|jgi:outer membrane receptor protein involved in Fe transport|nr:TonB-dependent receptor [Gracilimonas sp.]
MIKKLLIMHLALFVTSAVAFAQSGNISGTVSSSQTGELLTGVNIYVVELQRGAATGINGEYSIENIPYGEYTFRVSFVGFNTLTENVTIDQANQTVNFEISEDLMGLEEIVVTGQGSGIRRDRLSTTVDVISANKLEEIPSVQLDQVLQANLPNSQIRLSSGQPGTASLIRGRGIGSALTSTTPVIYVDGVRVDNTNSFNINTGTGGAQSSAIADIPIENIERIEFVKGGAATTQFGSDAANGVIQIFTKKGVQGSSQFSLETQLGATVGTEDFLKYDRTADILYSPGTIQEYQLTGSGGSENYTYSFSGSMRGNEGFKAQNEEIRHNLRAGFTANVNEYMSYEGSLGFTSNEFERDWNANTSASIFAGLEGGSYGDLSELDSDDYDALSEELQNAVSLVDISENVKRFQTSNKLKFNLSEGLSASALVGLDYRNSGQRVRNTNEWLIAMGFAPEGTTDLGTLRQSDRDFLALTLEASARYEKDFGDISTITNAGAQLFRNDEESIAITSNGLPDGSFNADNGNEITGTDFQQVLVNYGIYVLENISYKNTYVVELGLRVDNNTAFGETVDPQIYPKVGLAYNLSSEQFFQDNVPNSVISNLRLRANYGFAGNFPTPFSNQVLASIDSYLGGGTIEFGTPGDIALKPERTETIELGSDIALINDKVSLGVTYYQSETTDALFTAPFAPSTGLGTALQNLGVIENSGFEVSSTFNVVRNKNMSINLNASVNTLNNEVVDNGNSAAFAVGGFAFLGSYVDEGQPVGFLRGNRPIFAEDGSLADVEPNAVLGTPIPDYFGSISLNGSVKSFSFNITSDYQVGAQGVAVDDVLRYFGGVNDEGRIPEASAAESFFDLAGVWVEDTDYFKVRTISLSYNIAGTTFDNAVRSVRLGFSVTNPLSFASSSFDPEVTGAGIARGQGGLGVGGFGFGTESPPRNYVGSIKINF